MKNKWKNYVKTILIDHEANDEVKEIRNMVCSVIPEAEEEEIKEII